MVIHFLPLKVRQDIRDWLEQMAYRLEPGRFRFCSESSYVPTRGSEGQVSTCFAVKIAWQTGVWEEWSEERKRACTDFIQSFQREDGLFFDPWLAKNSKLTWRNIASAILGRTPWNSLFNRKILSFRAETRQSAASLLMVGAKPLHCLPCEVSDPGQVIKYISSFDWSSPWSAGSYLSHLMFFLSVNRGNVLVSRIITNCL